MCRMRPPTWLACGLDQGPSSLLPAWYQFWPCSFGSAAPPSQFRRGRRTDLSPQGRVPPTTEVPGRALTPDSFKRLHIHAVPSSSTPARPFLHTSPDEGTQHHHVWGHSHAWNPDDVLVQLLSSSPPSLQHCAVAFVADLAHVSSHSGPVETLLR